MATLRRPSLVIWLAALSMTASALVRGAEQAAALSEGVVIESVAKGSAGDRAGLQPGDVLLSWVRPPALTANDMEARGEFRTAFDWMDMAMEQAARGAVNLFGVRDRTALSLTMPPTTSGVAVRPYLSEGLLSRYQEARRLLDAQEFGSAIALWRETATGQVHQGRHELACWLFLRLGDALAEAHKWDDAHEAYGEALEVARQGPKVLQGSASARVWKAVGEAFEKQNEPTKAEAAYRQALEIWTRLSPDGLDFAASLTDLGGVAWTRGDSRSAEELFKRTLAIRERLAPGSLATAMGLNNLGLVARYRGDLAVAEVFYKRSLPIMEALVPESLTVAASLNNLGYVASSRGDLVAAEEFHKRSLAIRERLAPSSLDVAASLSNLGAIAQNRGDLAAAIGFYERHLAIAEVLAPGSLHLALSLDNLGTAARDSGDLDRAEVLHQRALVIREQLAPGSLDVAATLNNLGTVARGRGNLAAAEEFYRRDLAITEALAPGSLDVAWSLDGLANTVLDRGDLAAAEEYHQRALAIRKSLAPGSAAEAESWHSLATILRRRGDRVRAIESFHHAIQALETQRGRLGGSEDVRSGFAVKYDDFYHDYIDVLLEAGRRDEALHVLERSRARSLLSMLAERDLVFAAEIPAELARERNAVNGEYDRAQAELGELSPKDDAQTIEGLLVRLRELREQQSEVAGKIKKASPRLASLQYPEPLDLAGIERALDPGTILLAYSVGKDRTYLFVVQPVTKILATAANLMVHTLPTGEEVLRGRVETLRNLTHRRARSDGALIALGRQLYDSLVRPAEPLIEKSQRVVILPDGPLHTLPFAALVRDEQKGKPSYFVEWRSLHSVVSATVYAEIKRARREPRARAPGSSLAAFGDPVYPALPRDGVAKIANAALRSVVVGGHGLEPLPGTRKEVEGIARLYGKAAVAYLGAEATEERARSLSKGVRFVHFASHGLLNERFPLDSALALTIPERAGDGRENGLLQAWEIFQDVRMDADLVTLSACETGLGKEMGGEGLVGLTRAFQYAGARSVLASLWSVSDESTATLMRRFYGYLKAGLSKDEALRKAQLDLIHSAGNRVGDTSHPFHWAGFQLIGDWR